MTSGERGRTRGGGPERLVDRLLELETAEGDVSVDEILDAVGTRSFGPVLLVGGLVAVSPLSGIPGVPTTVGVIVVVTGAQVVVGAEHLWLPKWVLSKTVRVRHLRGALTRVRGPARVVGGLLRQRMLVAVAVAVTMPPLEVLPFAATSAGALLSLFGLALTAKDGLLALAGLLGTASLLVVVGVVLL